MGNERAMTPRTCPSPDCGKPLVRREGETAKGFLAREACNQSCASKIGRLRRVSAKAQGRTCAVHDCNEPIVQREGERNDHFVQRQTCSRKCAGDLSAAKRDDYYSAAYWPKVTGEIDWNGAFAKHNVRANDGGVFRISRPLNHSPTGNSASLLVEAAR